MKKYILYILTGVAACGLCSCEDALDRYPKDRLTPDNFFHTEEECQLYTNDFYTIPKRLTSKVGIKECRVYFSGENLATWSALKNDFLDPEQAAADSDKKSNVYPWCRTYSVGLNLTF